jgi:hypothetical protein
MSTTAAVLLQAYKDEDIRLRVGHDLAETR